MPASTTEEPCRIDQDHVLDSTSMLYSHLQNRLRSFSLANRKA